MKKVFYTLAIVLFTAVLSSCNKYDHDDFGTFAQQDIEARAVALGFDDADSYRNWVSDECAAGNHENCDVYNNGTHEACAYSNHSGRNHDGTHHNGTNHGKHDQNGHSHNSHSGKHR